MLNKLQIEYLKTVDPDRCRAAMFADAKTRGALLTLYAFHAEVAKVPELVSEPMIGNIRYQWWRDALDEIYSGQAVRQHEVTTLLAKIVRDYDVPRYWLDGLIDGRERDLDPTPFKNIAAAQKYCRSTSGTLMQIAGHIADPKSDSASLLTAGEAWGMTGLARSWKYYHGSILSNIEFEDLLEATEKTYLNAQEELRKPNAKIMPSVAYLCLVPSFVRRMKVRDYHPAEMTPNYPPLQKQLSLMKAIFTGRI